MYVECAELGDVRFEHVFSAEFRDDMFVDDDSQSVEALNVARRVERDNCWKRVVCIVCCVLTGMNFPCPYHQVSVQFSWEAKQDDQKPFLQRHLFFSGPCFDDVLFRGRVSVPVEIVVEARFYETLGFCFSTFLHRATGSYELFTKHCILGENFVENRKPYRRTLWIVQSGCPNAVFSTSDRPYLSSCHPGFSGFHGWRRCHSSFSWRSTRGALWSSPAEMTWTIRRTFVTPIYLLSLLVSTHPW